MTQVIGVIVDGVFMDTVRLPSVAPCHSHWGDC